jgi:NADPH-dependent 2,4-dienoyl-CoA reductase/sulfur reductase-like enzyme
MRRVVVLGAGPAGLSAAVAARSAGAEVVLLDSEVTTGGQFWRHAPGVDPGHRLQHAWRAYTRLDEGLAEIEVVTQAHVWNVEPDDGGIRIHSVIGPIDGDGRPTRVDEADAFVLAPGAHDRALPFPGWDLPGVTTAGAAQALAKRDGVALGRRTVVAGTGPFLLPVALSLVATGAEVAEIDEANAPGGILRAWGTHPGGWVGASTKARELAQYAALVARHRIPYRVGRTVVRAEGDGRVEQVVTAGLRPDWTIVPGSQRTVAADSACVGYGFVPRLETLIAAGCRLTPDRFVHVDDAQLTSVPGVFAAGEVTGIGGAELARAEGTIAGLAAAGGSLDGPAARRALRSRARFRRFAGVLEDAFGIRPGWTTWPDDDTPVCRCEETSCGALRRAADADPGAGLRSLKLLTRAGLGACQARTCGRNVEDLLVAWGHPTSDTVTDRRPLSSPIRLGELAGAAPPRPASPPS